MGLDATKPVFGDSRKWGTKIGLSLATETS